MEDHLKAVQESESKILIYILLPMCIKVIVNSEATIMSWGSKRLKHQTVLPGGIQHFLSGTKLKSPPGKTDQPVHVEAEALKGQMDKEK